MSMWILGAILTAVLALAGAGVSLFALAELGRRQREMQHQLTQRSTAEVPALAPAMHPRHGFERPEVAGPNERSPREIALERTVKALGEAVIEADVNGRVVWMNPAAEALSGWKQREAIGQRRNDIFPLEEPPPSMSMSGAMAQVMRVINRDGDRIPVVHRRSMLMDNDKQLMGSVLILRDVSQEQQTLEELHSSRRNFQEVIRKTPYGVAIVRDHKVVYANPRWASSLGYHSSRSLVGLNIADILHPCERLPEKLAFFEGGRDLLDAVTSQMIAPLEIPQTPPEGTEFRFLRQGGGVTVLELSPIQVIRFDRAPACLLVARDVTDLKKLQTQLMIADRMVSVGTLAAGVAHEINNPLAYVIANVEYMQRRLKGLAGGMPEEERQDLLEVLSESFDGAQRVKTIVRDLKTFSRSDNDRREAMDVHEVLESSLKLAWTEIRHRATLVRDYGKGVPIIEANEARLGQVFLNLMVNAAHAMPEGEADRNIVKIKTWCTPQGQAAISVQDSGCGIGAEDLQRIFDPFFTTKPVGVGTGLGLSICHNIITAMGGQITVDSTVGVGTTFQITLPAAAVSQVSLPIPIPPSLQDIGPRGRILVVDDDPNVGKALCRTLGRHRMEVVNNGREAIERCIQEDYDIILCDLMMPEISGMDVHAELAARRPAMSQRMIFITGGAFTPRARQFLDGVDNSQIDKPFEERELRLLVRERLIQQAGSSPNVDAA